MYHVDDPTMLVFMSTNVGGAPGTPKLYQNQRVKPRNVEKNENRTLGFKIVGRYPLVI